MFIKKLKPNTYDVFVGNGWSQWARITRRGGEVQQVEGSIQLDRRSLQQLKARLTK